MFKTYLFLIFFISTICSDSQIGKACQKLNQASKILGCSSSEESNLLTLRLCENAYQVQENDTCQIIAQNLKLNENLIFNIIDCNNLKNGQTICVNSQKDLFVKQVEPTNTFINQNLLENVQDVVTQEPVSEFTVSMESDNIDNETLSERKKQDFEEGLKTHNYYRALHKAKALTYNETIAIEAQKWADTLAKEKKSYHNYHKFYGENLAQACKTKNFTGKKN